MRIVGAGPDPQKEAQCQVSHGQSGSGYSPLSNFILLIPFQVRYLLGGTVFSGEQNPRQPVGMGKPRTRQFSCFNLHIVLDPANGNTLSVHQQIGRASISVIGLADAAGIRYGHSVKPPYVRTMNMPVDHGGSAERRIGTWTMASRRSIFGLAAAYSARDSADQSISSVFPRTPGHPSE